MIDYAVNAQARRVFDSLTARCDPYLLVAGWLCSHSRCALQVMHWGGDGNLFKASHSWDSIGDGGFDNLKQMMCPFNMHGKKEAEPSSSQSWRLSWQLFQTTITGDIHKTTKFPMRHISQELWHRRATLLMWGCKLIHPQQSWPPIEQRNETRYFNPRTVYPNEDCKR